MTIDEYIAQFPEDVQTRMQTLRTLIHETVPGLTEKMSWQMPTFAKHGNVVHFAGHKKHIGLYPGPGAIAAYAEALEPYKTSKGAVQFPLDKPLPLDLIRKIVAFSAAENEKNA